jgi:TRAF3-interacting protein 1
MSDYWSKTGELFGKLIEKPKMHEKLLKKPPPKYIYDIVMNTMKKTGFPKGIFTPQEEDPKYFEKDARHKMDILQKVIDITKIVTNENFEIKCSNILKGEEPNKTNYFLQKFYEAATNGNDNSKFIQKYLDHKNKKKDDTQKPEKNEKKESTKKVEKNEKKEKKAPTGIISENEKNDDFDNNKNDNLGGELKSGTGMKLDKHIFRHDDIMDEKKDKKNIISNVDLDAIKNYVQEITKNCNPIGKIIEFIGDDIDGMNKELLNWINESKSYKDKYEDEIKKSDETLLPLQNELLELEDSIRDEQMQIKSIKSRLIKNEKIIQNLITNVISFKGETQ